MSPQKPPSAPGGEAPQNTPQGDPWHAFGYLVSGVLAYGLIGLLLDRWLGTSFLVVVGILAGAGLGIYMTFARFNRPWNSQRGQGTESGPGPAAPHDGADGQEKN